jgi:antitoxin (DNA-binding transcriptional repressor) of toxin-antitoxin stability system
MFHRMDRKTATIRELRTDFRAVKRKVEQHGEVLITDRGEPAYVIKAIPAKSQRSAPLPDYYRRLLRRQPKQLSSEATRRFWEEERG